MDLVARNEVLVSERFPPLRLDTFVTGLSAEVTVDELVEVMATQRVLLEREVLVGAQVVDPELGGPRLLGGRLLVKKSTLAFTPWA